MDRANYALLAPIRVWLLKRRGDVKGYKASKQEGNGPIDPRRQLKLQSYEFF